MNKFVWTLFYILGMFGQFVVKILHVAEDVRCGSLHRTSYISKPISSRRLSKKRAGNPFLSCICISSKFCKTLTPELQVKLMFLLCSFSTTLRFSSFHEALVFLEVFSCCFCQTYFLFSIYDQLEICSVKSRYNVLRVSNKINIHFFVVVHFPIGKQDC